MPREDAIEIEGTIVESLPNTRFRVALANGHRILAFTSAQMRLGFVRLVPGDKVVVELSPYDLSKGCITHTLNAL